MVDERQTRYRSDTSRKKVKTSRASTIKNDSEIEQSWMNREESNQEQSWTNQDWSVESNSIKLSKLSKSTGTFYCDCFNNNVLYVCNLAVIFLMVDKFQRHTTNPSWLKSCKKGTRSLNFVPTFPRTTALMVTNSPMVCSYVILWNLEFFEITKPSSRSCLESEKYWAKHSTLE